MALSELQRMVLGIGRSYQAAGKQASFEEIQTGVTRLAGEAYSPRQIENAIQTLETALKARAARRTERDATLSQMFAEMRQAPQSPVNVVSQPKAVEGAEQTSPTVALEVSAEMFDNRTEITVVQQPGTSLLQAADAFEGKYWIDPDLKEAPGAKDVLPANSPAKVHKITIEWDAAGYTRATQNKKYGKGREEADLLVLGLAEADWRTKGKGSLLEHNGKDFFVRGKVFTTAKGYRVAVVYSFSYLVDGDSYDGSAYVPVAAAFSSNH